MERNKDSHDQYLPPVVNPFLEKIKNTFFAGYFPVQEYKDGVILLTTNEIFMKFQNLYPDPDYSIADVANWLHEKGYQIFDAGEMRYQWLLMPGENALSF